jgi:predicted Holliday junction resolvase-like endonuclease
MEYILITGIVVAVSFAAYYLIKKRKKIVSLEELNELDSKGLFLKKSDLSRIEGRIGDLPRQIFESISGSVSEKKGKLGELVAYLKLSSEYDKLIPLGDIVDFIGITFPRDGYPGKLVFIDVKNGKASRLSQDQKTLKKIIESNNIQFMKYKIETENVLSLNIEDEEIGP